jgi:hypothetical protein
MKAEKKGNALSFPLEAFGLAVSSVYCPVERCVSASKIGRHSNGIIERC